MPEYEFELDDGSVTTQYFPVDERPLLDCVVQLEDGRWAKRIMSLGQRPVVADVGHTDFQHHRDPNFKNDELCLKGPDGKRAYPRVNEKGQPVWKNKAEINEACARMGWTWGDCEHG